MTKTLEHALFYADHGWKVFPLKEKDKVPTVKWADVATTDKDIITSWWTANSAANVGIMTGSKSGLLVLDIDAGHGGETTLTELQNKYGELPQTPVCRTGGGGRHFFFKYADGTKNTASKIGAGIDTRSEGGYVVGANSLHPSGHFYEWDKEHLPSKTQLADAPAWLLKILIDEKPTQQIVTTSEGAYISGQRNNALTSLAGTMRRKNMSEDAIFLALNAENLNRCIPPLPESEVRLIVSSVMRYDPSAAMPLVNKDRVQAEWGLVKCVYEWPNIANEYNDVKPTDFGQKELGDFWQAINSGIDVTTAAIQCGLMSELEKASGYQVERVEGYVKAIKHYSYHASVLRMAESLKHHANAGNNIGVEKVLTDINRIPSQSENRIISISDTAESLEAEILERQKNPVKVWGIPYAWEYISELTGGKQLGELTYIVAEPKIGKSWWCLQDALATATDHNTPTFYWCGEMKRNQIMKRFYQMLGVNGRNMKSGNMTEQDWDYYHDAKALILNSPLFIDDKPIALHEVRPLLVKQIAENGIKQAYFDYARLIQAPGINDIEQSKNVSLEMKRICQGLNISLTVIASVNKNGMDSRTETAIKSNISGSSQQVHDVDNLFFITKFNGEEYGQAYGLKPNEYEGVKSFHLTASRELDHQVEGGFIAYRQNNSPKFVELRRK